MANSTQTDRYDSFGCQNMREPTHLAENLTVTHSHVIGALALLLVSIVACDTSAPSTQDVVVDTLPSGIVYQSSLKPLDSGQWHLRAMHELPGAAGGVELVAPEDIAVSDAGHIAIVDDAKPLTIRVFAPDGSMLGTVGRQGAGPGEYQQARVTFAGDTLLILDPQQRRLLLYAVRSRGLLAEHSGVCCAAYYPIDRDSSGALIASRAIARGEPGSRAPGFTRWRVDGSVRDTLWTLRSDVTKESFSIIQDNRQIGSVPIPFWPHDRWAVDRSGILVIASASDYMLRTTRTGLDTVQLFSRLGAQRALLSAEEKTKWIDERVAADRKFVAEPILRAALRADAIPNHRPWFERLWVDSHGRRWVALGRRGESSVQFDVFNRDGRWLDVISVASRDWPTDSWAPIAFGRDRVAVVLLNDDDVPVVRVFSIERK